MAASAIGVFHRRRLRAIWRSAGWPCRDAVEIDLLAAGLLTRRFDDQARETLHLTEAGIAELAATQQRNRAAFNAHEALVAQVAEQMRRAGRIVWRGLKLRAPLQDVASSGGRANGADGTDGTDGADCAAPTRWVLAMPDVYSIRNTTVEVYAEPVAHEIKVRRADLLSDLRHPDKGAAYGALASQCWYVLARGIADADEVPCSYGVMWADAAGLEVARPAPRRAHRVPFTVWMALARANAEPEPEIDPQPGLGDARPALG
ncbi:MAG: hypothetical protein M3Y32_07020 [Pseudomonadota bacterium]|nr:hypothetical protein [Pseudomonadota bacterium]